MHHVAEFMEEGLHLVVVQEGGLVIGWLGEVANHPNHCLGSLTMWV